MWALVVGIIFTSIYPTLFVLAYDRMTRNTKEHNDG